MAKTVRIKGLTPKWKSRVSQFGDTWTLVKTQKKGVFGTMFITDSLVGAGFGSVASWVTPGEEIEVVG